MSSRYACFFLILWCCYTFSNVKVEFVSSSILGINKTRMYLLMKKNNFYIDIIPVLV